MILQVPYEILNKRFRTAQKVVDREVSRVQASTAELEQCLQGSNTTIRDVTTVLDGMVDKLTILKRKVEIAHRSLTKGALYLKLQNSKNPRFGSGMISL